MNPKLTPALRQFCHNNGEPGFVMAYDKDIVDREFAMLEKRAAAPLPQVQSEALEAARYALRHAGSLYACGFNVAHARSCTNGVDATGVSGDEYDAVADDVRTAIRKALDLVRAALKSDQQPVTPSGALADNDGGVA